MTEDDTFRKLARPTYAEMWDLYLGWHRTTPKSISFQTEEIEQFLRLHGWELDEFVKGYAWKMD